jgi:hypothetical protein
MRQEGNIGDEKEPSEGYHVPRFWNNESPKSCAALTPTQTLPNQGTNQGGGLDAFDSRGNGAARIARQTSSGVAGISIPAMLGE